MDIIEYVKLNSDTNYVAVKYRVMNAETGSSAAASYLWLKSVGYGFDTKENYDAYIDSIKMGTFNGVKPVGIVGTMDEYVVSALSAVSYYKSNKSNHSGPFPIG